MNKVTILLLCAALGWVVGCAPRPATLEETLAAAESLHAQGAYVEMVALLEAFDERDPGRIPVLELLAFHHTQQEDHMLAAFYFSRLAEVDPTQPEYILYAATALRQAGDRPGAIRLYRQYLQQVPDNKGVWIHLAEIFVQSGDRPQAIDAYMRAHALAPEAMTEVELGRLFLQAGNWVQARRWFERALNNDIAVREAALTGLFETAIREQRFADAEAVAVELRRDFPQALRQPRLRDAVTRLRTWRSEQDALAEAAAALTRNRELAAADAAPAVAPVDAPADLQTAATPDAATVTPDATADANRDPVPERATAPMQDPAVQRAVPAVVDPVAALLSDARAASAAGDIATAARAYRRALARDDSRVDIWIELSVMHFESGDSVWAETAAREALRRQPEDAEIHMHYLMTARNVLEPDAFVWQINHARQQFPDVPDFTLLMARVLRDMYQNPPAAARWFNEFLRQAGPDHPQYAMAREELRNL